MNYSCLNLVTKARNFNCLIVICDHELKSRFLKVFEQVKTIKCYKFVTVMIIIMSKKSVFNFLINLGHVLVARKLAGGGHHKTDHCIVSFFMRVNFEKKILKEKEKRLH